MSKAERVVTVENAARTIWNALQWLKPELWSDVLKRVEELAAGKTELPR